MLQVKRLVNVKLLHNMSDNEHSEAINRREIPDRRSCYDFMGVFISPMRAHRPYTKIV